jgi:hypothetical protein
MCGPHEFDLNKNRQLSKLHATEFFRHLGTEALTDFNVLTSIATYSKGALLQHAEHQTRDLDQLLAYP